MVLPDLLIEVLTQIMEGTLPDGFESLSMTCKSVYIKGESVRRKHNDLARRYRNFSYDTYENFEDNTETPAEEISRHLSKCYSSLQLLLRIAEEPLIAEYMVSADFKHDDDIPLNKQLIGAIKTQAKESGNLLHLLSKSAYFHQAGFNSQVVLDHLVTKYDPQEATGTSCVAAIFLLTLLQNLTTLAIPDNWEHYDWGNSNEDFWERDAALKDLTMRANDPNDPTAGLSKLTSIIPSIAWGYNTRWPLERFNPFLSIKTVTSFIAGGCVAIDDGYTGCPFPVPTDENYGINIEEVILAGAVIDAKEFQIFLQCLPKLKHLKLSYETKYHGCGHDMDAHGILAAIESTTSNTLESLTFAVINFYGDVSTISPLKGFTKLKELELDSQVVLEMGCSATDVCPLGDLIPASVERFCLLVENVMDYRPMLNRLFEGVAAGVEEKLPNLKELVIRFREGNPGSEWLEIVDKQEDSEAGPSIDPWKRELAALGKIIDVRTVQVQDTATFMEGFVEKYRVVPEY